MLDEVKNASEKIIGVKQVLSAAERSSLKKIFIAANADEDIKQSIVTAAEENGICYELTPYKKELGRAAGIEVGAACVGLIKDP